MRKLADSLVGFVAILHMGFLLLEMFLWKSQIGLKVFKMTHEIAETTAVLAINQGLYNGFLAAGLIWSFFISNDYYRDAVRIFFLVCIIIAGIFGALTAKFSILFLQALPAICALLAVLAQRDKKRF